MALTDEDIEIEYWAHRHAEDPKLAEAMRDDDFDPDAIQAEVESGVWETLRDGIDDQ